MYDVTATLLGLPDPFSTTQALDAGLTQNVMERLVRNGNITRVRRGLFRKSPAPDPEVDRWARIRGDHLARTRVAILAHPDHAASHLTAAALYAWPVRLHPATLVNLTAVFVQPRSRRIADRFLHHSDSITNNVVQVQGLPVLDAARTVADCLRSMRAPSAVAIADAALREGSTTRQHVEEILAAQRHWRGRPGAIRALPFVDPRRESWLESYSFMALAERDIEPPIPQVEVFDASYNFVGRVDGMWIQDATVAEADGLTKYLIPGCDDTAPSGRSAAERVVAERKRERLLLDVGLEVVRWDTQEMLHEVDRVAGRVRSARGRGDIRRFRGHLRVDGTWLNLPNTA